MAVVGNFYFSIFLRLTWEFLGLESERGGSVCWPNNFIIMAVMGNFYFFIFLRLTWEFIGFESERGGSVCWPIIR